jgi:hypothetical protein
VDATHNPRCARLAHARDTGITATFDKRVWERLQFTFQQDGGRQNGMGGAFSSAGGALTPARSLIAFRT